MNSNKSFFIHLPPGLFAIPLGLCALAGVLGRMEKLVPTFPAISLELILFVCLLWSLLLLTVIGKYGWARPQFLQELNHPVQGSLMALLPVSALLLLNQLAQRFPAESALWTGLMVVSLLVQLFLAWRMVKQISLGQMPKEMITPALYVPPVAGGFVGAMALQTLGFHGFAALLFGMGVGAWFLLEVRILNSLFEGPLPLPLRPTIGVELAPIPVGTLTASVVWPDLPDAVLLIGLGMACAPFLAVMGRFHSWREAPFSPAFWSFSFPLAAFVAVALEVIRRGGWPIEVAWLFVLRLLGVILFLLVRTLGFWLALARKSVS